MNTYSTVSMWALAAGMAISLGVPAAESHRCAQQVDDVQRLGCYDAAFGKPRGSIASSPASVTPVVPPTPSPAPQVATTERQPGKPKADAAPAAFKASITALSSRPDGRFVATFDNGQIWTQLEADRAVELAVGDAVTVRKGMLGSFQLVTPGGRVTRVKKVE